MSNNHKKHDYNISGDIGRNLSSIIGSIISIGILGVIIVGGIAYINEQERKEAREQAYQEERAIERRKAGARDKIQIALNSSVCETWLSGDKKLSPRSKWEDVDYVLEKDALGYLATVEFNSKGKSLGGNYNYYDYTAEIRFSEYGDLEKCISIKYEGRNEYK